MDSSSPSSSSSSSASSHAHTGGKCPYVDKEGVNSHAFCPKQSTDNRAPCPALNTMANHGYLPRDGNGITAEKLIQAMKECFNLSNTLAWFLTHGALGLLGQSTSHGKQLSLHDFARHNGVEHDASLYHPDAEGKEYAPIERDDELFAKFFADSKDGRVMAPLDIARVRARRQADYPKDQTLDFIHAELARGEIAIVLNCFNNPDPELHAQGVPLADTSLLPRFVQRLLGMKPNPATTPIEGVPIDRLRYWFEHERLPEGWKPYHKTTLRQTISTVNVLRSGIRRFSKDYPQGATTTPAPVPVQEIADVPAVPEIVEPAKASEGEASESPVETEAEPEKRREASEDSQTLEVVPSLVPDTPGSATSSVFTPLPTPSTSGFTESHAHVQLPQELLGKSVAGIKMKANGAVKIEGLPEIAENTPFGASWLQSSPLQTA
ncbi:hypothetical protein EIP86_009402 [Pleurotus ostreatoroseus]|nr:hypothetical protein EIP86_009402 [Pleurotus ostreatoroseus]